MLLSGQNISKRSSESIHRYVEIVVVCDKKFIEYHNAKDVELYVMTIMNMVSLTLIIIDLI